ncbi:MAG TPA: FAD:protein FMN transferase, partial [Acidimicrobiia bacterium]
MIYIDFRAMGTKVEAWCPNESAGEAVQGWFEEVEQVCSRFREDSELSQINGSNGGRIYVSETLAKVLRAGEQALELTGGLVDIGVGSRVAAWGYDRTFDLVTSLDQAPPRSTEPEWSLEGRTLTISAGTQLDLGGIAKGWACDMAIEKGLATVVSAGGDIRSIDTRTVVPIIDPWGAVPARISLGSGGLATSSTARRRW